MFRQSILGSVGIALLATVAQADQFININFGSDTAGQAPAYAATPAGQVQTVPYSIGGYTSTSGEWGNTPPTLDSGTITVNDISTLSKAALLTTNASNKEIGALYMDTQFNVASQKLTLSFDIGVLAAPTTMTEQLKKLNQTDQNVGILFGINVFPNSGSGVRFALAPTSEDGGIFALRSADNTRLISFGEYVEGQIYHVELVADYDTGTVDAYLNGALALSDHQFSLGGGVANASTSEIFMFLNGQEGYGNQIAIDNIQASTVPEPATLGLFGLAGASLLLNRKARKH